MHPDYKPELDTSRLCTPGEHRRYQQLIGIGVWLQTIGRIDICFAISSLSRFSAGPRYGQLLALIKLYGYLKKYPKRVIKVDPSMPKERGKVGMPEGGIRTFMQQYPDAVEELDPKFPVAKGKPLHTQIWFDANHTHDKVTRRSISGLLFS